MLYILLTILAILVLMQFQLAWQLFNLFRLRYPRLRYWMLVLSLVILCAIAVYGFIPRGSAPRVLTLFSYYYLAVLAYSVFLFLLRDIILFVIKLFRKRRDFSVFVRRSTVFVFAMSIIIVLYGSFHAQNIQINRYDIQLEKYTSTERTKVAVFSDLHLGAQYGHKKVAEIVDVINRETVDMVFIVGDMFNDDYHALDNPEAIVDALKNIKAELGVYLVWGNHDSGPTFTLMQDMIDQSKIIRLEDEVLQVDNVFTLVGRRDSRPIMYEGITRAAINWSSVKDKSLPLIVLDHQPSNYSEYLETDVDLIISGHTHRGQIFPGNFMTRLVYDYDYGLHETNEVGQQILVSSGIGTWGPPIRVMTNSELLFVTIAKAE